MRQIIRSASAEDTEALALLARSSDFCAHWSRAEFEAEIKNDFSRIFTIVKDDILAGFIAFRFCLQDAELTNFAVSPAFYRCGLGSSLLEYGLKKAAEENVLCVTLEVNERNAPAAALYRKFLFKTVNIRKKFYNNTDNALLMLRNL